MRIVKGIIVALLVLVAILVLVSAVILLVDGQRTNYLKISLDGKSNVDSYLITNVHVIPMNTDAVFTDHMVLIRDGKIAAIDSIIEAPDVEVVDGGDGYLMPGLADMHVHVWDKYELGLYLANGVTAIRNVWGMPMHLRMKREIIDDRLFAPKFYTTGPKLTGPEFIGSDNLQLYSAGEAVEKVKSYRKRGYDYIKTYYGLPEEIFDAIIEQARISDMDIVAHASQKVPYEYHFNPQIVSIEHAEDIVQLPLDYDLDTSKLNGVVNAFSRAEHTSFCPTLIAFYNIYNMLRNDDILSGEQVSYMNPLIRRVDSKAQFERWHSSKQEDPGVTERINNQHAFHLYIIKELHDAGVNIVCGTDAGIGVTVPGQSIHEELDLYRQAGLNNYEVLRTATANVALTHDEFAQMGTIEVGKIANLILLRDNPIEDPAVLEQPGMVFLKGRKLNRETLDSFTERARDRKNLIATMIRYAENTLIEK